MAQKGTKAKTALLSLKNLLTNKKSNYAGHKAFKEPKARREIKATPATLAPQAHRDYKGLLEKLAPKVHRVHKASKVKSVHRGQRVIKAIRETLARPAILL